jgi:hypothetical protein
MGLVSKKRQDVDGECLQIDDDEEPDSSDRSRSDRIGPVGRIVEVEHKW